MNNHPAIAPGRVAVITGGANGIGLAVALRCAAAGMRVCLADISDRLADAADEVARAGALDVMYRTVDVAVVAQVCAFRDAVFDRFGEVGLLMNNAAIAGGGDLFSGPGGWQQILGVNLGGIVNGVQAFVQPMVDQGKPAAIVNTGSKQGFTAPPGNTAYNVTKAAVRTLTEGLAHSLRQIAACQVSAHLLVPGFTYSAMIARHFAEKPAAAWTCDQVAEGLLSGLARRDFYIWCQDNETSRAIDERRLQWAQDDVIRNRPALSRWHPDFKDEFEAFCASGGSPE